MLKGEQLRYHLLLVTQQALEKVFYGLFEHGGQSNKPSSSSSPWYLTTKYVMVLSALYCPVCCLSMGIYFNQTFLIVAAQDTREGLLCLI